MIKKIKYTLVITIGVMLIGKVIINSFSKEVITSLEMVLQAAEENRNELVKVLRHYQKNPADSLK